MATHNPTPNPPKQRGFAFEPAYAVSDTGTKHEFKNGLLVPTPDEIARIDEQARRQKEFDSHVGLVVFKRERQTVRMNPLEGLMLRKGTYAKTFQSGAH